MRYGVDWNLGDKVGVVLGDAERDQPGDRPRVEGGFDSGCAFRRPVLGEAAAVR
jgi:hypothetical protein